MEKFHLEITWGSLWRVLAFVLALFLFYQIREVIILFALAIVISALCQPFVNFLEKKKIPRFLGTTIVFIAIILILAVFLWLIIPLTISQLGNVISSFNDTFLKDGSQGFFAETIQQFIANLKAAFDVLVRGATTIFNLAFSIFGGVFWAVTCLVLSFYLTVEEKGIENFFRVLLPKKYENQIISIFERSTVRIGYWLQGRLILSVIVGLLTWLGLYLLGVKYSGTLALITAILENIPLIGPIFAGLLAFQVALTDSWILAIWVVVFAIAVQQLEGILFTPLIMKKATGLPALVVLLALLVGAKLAGLLGFLLAIPIAIVIQEIFDEGMKKRNQI